jgi:hypothetical protein
MTDHPRKFNYTANQSYHNLKWKDFISLVEKGRVFNYKNKNTHTQKKKNIYIYKRSKWYSSGWIGSTDPDKYLPRHTKLVLISAAYHITTCSDNGSDKNQQKRQQ